MSVLLDTHIWVQWLMPGSGLSRTERDSLDASAGRHELFLSAISLWEAQVLHAKSRIELPLPFAEWLAYATDDRMLSIVPLDVKVVLSLNALPESFHGDPADRLIVASARAHSMPLATHDSNIRRSRAARLWKP